MGPFIDVPVIVQILVDNLSRNQAVSEIQMHNLRHIMENFPDARDNMHVLTEHLAEHLRKKSEAAAQQGQPVGSA